MDSSVVPIWVQVVFCALGVFIPVVTALVAGSYAWHVKSMEIKASARAEADRLSAAKEQGLREAEMSNASLERKQYSDFYAQVIADSKSDRLVISQLQTKIGDLQNEVHALSVKLDFYEDNPTLIWSKDILMQVLNVVVGHPAWLHDVSHSKWYVNDSYCTEYGVERAHFWTPVNLLGSFNKADALEYVRNDFEVVEAGHTLEFVEMAQRRVMDPACTDRWRVRVRKTPITVSDRTIVFGEVMGRYDSPGALMVCE